ncbi:hypothetical protein C2845_PM05G03700 [Panicum miliaceum]|uniref:Polyamine transporter n=1 Tax=Panicum miliaceum TaxID=4540 RepID=A0A3L6STH0_PANMI|nr:hypothetical protein C2845_PM05G03700 [Panicum miliaceum]
MDSVRAGGGALLPVLGFLVLPALWSLPEALVTAELASAFPTNAGYVAWVSAAFGPAAAFLVGFTKWASGTLDNALYPIRRARWLAIDVGAVNLRGYFNSMFWNLNYWDKASTLAGEVEEPRKTFPKAVFGAVGLVVGAYLIPLLAGTGALPSETAAEWTDGFFSEVGQRIGGPWLRVWIQAAAAMSNMGLFEAEMSSDSFQLLGMAEMGMIPAIFARRSKHGRPTFSILCSATGVVILSFMSFQEIIEFLNFLYGLGMLVVFAAFVKLRVKNPDLPRPYRIPVGTAGAAVMTVIVNAAVVAAGVALYYGVKHAKRRAWVEFLAPVPPPPDSSHGSTTASDAADVEDVRAGLLADEPADEASARSHSAVQMTAFMGNSETPTQSLLKSEP